MEKGRKYVTIPRPVRAMSTRYRAAAIGAILMVALGVMLSGCTSAPETPTIRITAPANGATVLAGDVRVDVDVENFNIVDKAGQAPVLGEGHVHFYMDLTTLPSTAGQPATPPDPGILWAHVTDDTYTFTNVSPGVHTFAAQLVNNDHTPVVPVVSDTVTITVTTPG